MSGLLQVLGLFGLSFFSFSVSIPAGLALGLPPLLVIAITSLAYTAGVVITVLIGESLRTRLLARFGGGLASNPESVVRKAWDRFGVVGLSALAPVTVGAQIGAVVALALGAEPRRLTVMMSLSALLWSIGLTLAVAAGVSLVR
jgi:formate/nitrite transporter FocA (FNT family)